MWVQLITVAMIEVQGKPKHYRPGDWIDLPRQHALRMITEGKAVSPRPISDLLPAGSGIVLVDVSQHVQSQIAALGIETQRAARPAIPYARTLILQGEVDIRSSLFPAGFNLLSKWQVVAPLYSYDKLALHLGTEKEREMTKKVIHDLRVPVYDMRVLFLRKCPDTVELLDCWRSELKAGSDQRLAFMRAYYRVKPQLCAVPTTWLDRTAGA